MNVVEWLLDHWRLMLVAALVAWGGWGELRVLNLEAGIAAAELKATRDLAGAKDAARKSEQALNKKNSKVTNDLLAATKARDAAARTAAQRLRDLAEARAAADAAAASCRNLDAPAIAVLPDATGDALVALAQDADEVSDRLLACQAYIRDVVKPE